MNNKGSLEIAAGLVIVAGAVIAILYWSAFLREPDLDLVEVATTTMPTKSASTSNSGFAPYASGISGTVMHSGTPYKTLVAIYRKSDPVHAVVIGESDEAGEFEASLPPGEYIVGAGENNTPQCKTKSVTVLPEVYSSITITCD